MRLLSALLVAAASSTPGPDKVVASVRVETPPGYERSNLAAYVDIKPGDSLDPTVVRKSVELLHATGQFEDVVVEATTTAAGVDLVFHPRPAPLLDRILVEGDHVISPGALAQVTRLRKGEALWASRLESAAQTVAVALGEKGYLEARVTAEARRRIRAADAAFHVVAGSRAKVGSIALEGAPPQSEEELRAMAPTPGGTFRRAEERRALERMRGFFVNEGYWRARSDVLETYHPDTALMDLSFRLEPGERTSVEFRGARLPHKVQTSLVGILREGSLARDAVEQVSERIEETLLAEGYRDAFVSHREEIREGETVLVYVTEPGPQARVAAVRFSGFAAADLQASVETRPLEPVVDRVLEEDVSRLKRTLQGEGYAGAEVEADVPDGGGSLTVTFVIRPGARTLVHTVTVDAPPGGPSLPDRRSREGEPYRASDAVLDREALLTAYRNAGYLQADVALDTSFSEDKADANLVFRVAPGPRIDVARIVIAGLDRTRPEVVRRELTLKEGQPLSQAGLLESQRRLSALGIFDRVAVTEIDPESPRLRSVVVTVEEASPTTFTYGLGYAEQDRLRGSVEVIRRNLLGMNRTLTLFARGSLGGNNRLFATLREPYLLGHRLDLFGTAFHEEGVREGFDFTRSGALLQTAFHAGAHAGFIVRFSYQKTHVFDVTIPLDEIDRQLQDSTSSGPSASFVDDTRDDPLDPKHGRFLAADLQLSSPVFGGDSFVKSFFQAAGFRRIVPRVVLAGSARLGLAWTPQASAPPELPLPDRFFAGGDNSIRGFALDTVGPLEVSTTGTLVPTGGNALIIGSAELRIDAGHRFSVALFSDNGNVYPLVRDMALDDIRYVAGLGLRYKSALGPVRVDWGYKLNRRPHESAGHLHVTIGHAF